jgi:hypothetical protein
VGAEILKEHYLPIPNLPQNCSGWRHLVPFQDALTPKLGMHGK